MTDEELLAQAPNLPVLYFDGFGAYRKMNGVLRCVGYTIELGAQANLIISLDGAELANRATRQALDGTAPKVVSLWNVAGKTH